MKRDVLAVDVAAGVDDDATSVALVAEGERCAAEVDALPTRRERADAEREAVALIDVAVEAGRASEERRTGSRERNGTDEDFGAEDGWHRAARRR